MRQRRRLGLALTSAAAGVAFLAIAAPALADPPGANGTVKIDGPEYQLDNRNEPHVSCEFQVEFFNFDADEHATLIFAAQPPSSNDFHEVGRLENKLVSDDAASGGAYTRDADEVFRFTAEDLDLTAAVAHPKQGYHIKLTVDRQNHPEWTEKHKVFWLQPCASDNRRGGGDSDENGGGGDEGGSGASMSPAASGQGGSLPLTGANVAAIAALGVGLVGTGAAVVIARRRRDNITFTS